MFPGMTSPAASLRSHLTSAENALVTDADVDGALQRACAGRSPRTRVEVAALMVYAGPYSTRVPALESRPLRRPLLVRLVTGAPRPVARPAVPAFEPCRAPAARLPQAA
jgi:hypothetical protein